MRLVTRATAMPEQAGARDSPAEGGNATLKLNRRRRWGGKARCTVCVRDGRRIFRKMAEELFSSNVFNIQQVCETSDGFS